MREGSCYENEGLTGRRRLRTARDTVGSGRGPLHGKDTFHSTFSLDSVLSQSAVPAQDLVC